jgi:DNA-binding transcriptional MocR family regulator
LYQHLARSVGEAIGRGEFAPGGRLPSERRLIDGVWAATQSDAVRRVQPEAAARRDAYARDAA